MSQSDDLFVQYKEFKDLYKQIRKEKFEFSVKEKCKLKELKEKITHNVKISQESAAQSRLIGIAAFVNLDFAKLLFVNDDEKEIISMGTIEMLKPYAYKDECLYIYLKVVNFAAFLLVKHEKLTESQIILEEAELIYFNKKQEESKSVYIFSGDELFKNSPTQVINQNLTEIYKIVTSNIQIQAYISYKLAKYYKFQLYENLVLQRQLESADGSPVLWAKKTTSLAAHFLCKGKFPEARHHLAAAYVVLQYCEEDMIKQVPNHGGKYNDLRVSITELAKMWVKYGITLFNHSCDNSLKPVPVKIENNPEHMQNPFYDPQPTTSNGGGASAIEAVNVEKVCDEINKEDGNSGKGDAQKNYEEVEKQIVFHSLNLENVESQVTAELIENSEQARQLFQFAYAWLVKLKSYHMISNLVTGHMDCMMYLEELYRYLAYYEKDIESKYNILKKRADTLDSLVQVLKANNVPLHAQLRIDFLRELSEVQLDLILLNINKLSTESEADNSGTVQNDEIRLYKMAAITRIHSKVDMCSRSLSKSAVLVQEKSQTT